MPAGAARARTFIGAARRGREDLLDETGAWSGELRAVSLVCVLLALLWTVPMESDLAWGWDETMHAELPALQMLFALQEDMPGEAVAALMRCERYPFVYPLVLSLTQGVFGPSERVCRGVCTVLWCLTLFGLFLLGRELRRATRAPGRGWLPWLVFGFGATCPLALAYAGTVFLEIPFLCAAVFALHAWIRRGVAETSGERARADLAAGAWLTVCFFTKFNYALLVWAGIGFDTVIAAIVAARAGELATFARRLARVAVIPTLALAWWFVLPWPGTLRHGAVHRAAFYGFMTGNLEFARVPWSARFLQLAGFFTPTLRLLLVLVAGIVLSLPVVGRVPARVFAALLVSMTIPVAMHNFFLDRFLIPLGLPIWALAALGWSRVLPADPKRAVAAMCAIGLFAGLFPQWDTPWLAKQLGLLNTEEPTWEQYQRRIFSDWRDLSGSRKLRSAGMRVDENRQFLDIVAAEVGPEERVGWLGITTEIGPCGLHFGLWERGGSRRRFVEHAHDQNFITITTTDPQWEDEHLRRFAALFDVILATDPVDMKRGGDYRAFLRKYQERLVRAFGWTAREIGRLRVRRPNRPSHEVKVYALRPPPS